MDKAKFYIRRIEKSEAAPILSSYHYLTGVSKGFKSGFNYGLFFEESCVGCAIFTLFPVPELSVGMFGIARDNQEGLFELSRLCLEPVAQKSTHNLASWFLSRCIKMLRTETNVRAILSYADSSVHCGTIYAACNFRYYGLTAPKKDFYFYDYMKGYTKHSRGGTKGLIGEWRERTRKHRFVIVFDKCLKIKWVEEKWKGKTNA